MGSWFLPFREVFGVYSRKPRDKGKPMPDIEIYITTCEEQRELVNSLVTTEINEVALDIAFYYAMHDAAIDDPLDDEEEQTALIAYFLGRLKELVERYQSLVNDTLP